MQSSKGERNMKQLGTIFVLLLALILIGYAPVQAQSDPASLTVKNAGSVITLDGKLDEADWSGAPTLIYGNGASVFAQPGDNTVTGGVDVKNPFTDGGIAYNVPNTDSSWARVKFLRKGMNLYIGITSNDKSICKFDWEGDGMFLMIKNSLGVDQQYKLYWQNIGTAADTIKYEEPKTGFGAGAGYLFPGSVVNDTTQVDSGYSAELMVRLDSLGYTGNVSSIQIALVEFDPDGFEHPMNTWDHTIGSYYKSWWGSEWGGTYRTLNFITEFDDPPSLTVKNAGSVPTLDGKLDESDWAGAPTLIYGNGAWKYKEAGEFSVTGGVDVKNPFTDGGITYNVPNTDSSWARVKFLRKGVNLYIGITSNDKSICKFDWEGDGMFLMIKNSLGVDQQYKLYWQNIGTAADTIKYEEPKLNFGMGSGYLFPGSVVNDTTQVDLGYSAELMVRLDSLGYTNNVSSIQIALDVFDPDGFEHPMNTWDHNIGSYYKSWWGSEWGGTYRTLEFTPEYDDTPSLTVKNAGSAPTLDGKLDESDWATAPTLIYGNGAWKFKQPGDFTVTGGVDVKNPFTDGGIAYNVPNTDSSWARVKFLRKGVNLYIGITSNDKSICKFDWEGDGMFLMIKNSLGIDQQYKLYWQNIGTAADTIKYEEPKLNFGSGAGYLFPGSVVNDTTQVDSGYSAELMVRLDSLGYTSNVSSIQIALDVFDPDGFEHPMNTWDHNIGSFYKSWWGSEWGGTYRTLNFITEFDDPPSLTVKNAGSAPTLDGKLDESDWATAPTLIYGNGAWKHKETGEFTVTGGVDVKNPFTDGGITYNVPNTDSSWARVKFLRKGVNLYIGITSNDKSICKFDWEGDGMFLMIKNSLGVDQQYKLYWQNIGTAADTIKYEEPKLNFGAGSGYLFPGSVVNDTTQVDLGYSAELMVRLDSLGYTSNVSSIQIALVEFDPDGFEHPMNTWDHNIGSFYKSWWGSEWGGTYRTLEFTPDYDDPPSLTVKKASNNITLDGKLDESDWAGAPTLIYGNGAGKFKEAGEFTVTGGVDVKNPFTDGGISYSVPNKDSSWARVKFLQKGMNLYLGITSNDKSICKFDWEGDGMFLMIKNSLGVDQQYKLYWQNIDSTANIIKYEEPKSGFGAGAGFLFSGSKVNDTTQVDSGYSAELMVRLDSLGFTQSPDSVLIALDVFDPDGFQHPMNSWDHNIGSYYKSWWGSEWGGTYRTLKLPGATGVVSNHEKGVPTVYTLLQNYPNPFNPTTTIQYGIPSSGFVTLKIYNTLGQEIMTLVNGEQHQGYYTASFNASALPSGLYFYRLQAGTFNSTRKMLLIK
jgi:tRNA threonylcarbamoyladenosine modification (KEOPS) complex  Pcc1 subunit